MRDLKTFVSAAAVVVALMVSALPAAAQTGRVGGTIKDPQGAPLKGATITAENPAASPSSFTATTDDKGRYSIIGLKTGPWKITAVAPGFAPSSGTVPVRSLGAPMPPVDFVLAPGATGPAGALAGVNTKELQAELQKAMDAANAGQHDAAITAYQAILTKTPAPVTTRANPAWKLPAAIDDVIEDALAKKPETRTASVGALADGFGKAFGLSGTHVDWAKMPLAESRQNKRYFFKTLPIFCTTAPTET